MATITARIEIDIESAKQALDEFRDRLSMLPEDVAQVVLHRFFSLLDAKPLEVIPSPGGVAADAGDGVVRLGIRGVGELCASALAADGGGSSDVFHVEPSV